ncbi:hypothetical protein BD309DRAFT_953783 [Dichomitus squalens]|uniref:Uncharacterized protein n=1 Tax=Dichomitus squalens TaxID=114155 RepID=A0A4Q9PVL8_9APHY|nr:hypothetical protein BD309DRAFT_953783 [Dichomitus squalens]TBU58424.1 hypothetical protein BD310DRAFT_927280 [Dichomitus squalens]
MQRQDQNHSYRDGLPFTGRTPPARQIGRQLPPEAHAQSQQDTLGLLVKKFEDKRAQMGFASGRCKRVSYVIDLMYTVK